MEKGYTCQDFSLYSLPDTYYRIQLLHRNPSRILEISFLSLEHFAFRNSSRDDSKTKEEFFFFYRVFHRVLERATKNVPTWTSKVDLLLFKFPRRTNQDSHNRNSEKRNYVCSDLRTYVNVSKRYAWACLIITFLP